MIGFLTASFLILISLPLKEQNKQCLSTLKLNIRLVIMDILWSKELTLHTDISPNNYDSQYLK